MSLTIINGFIPTEENLIPIVLGKENSFFRSKAMSYFYQSVHPKKAEIFQNVLENSFEATEYRRLAAFYLGEINSFESIIILKENLVKINVLEILSEIIFALGKIGEEDVLDLLDKKRLSVPKKIQKEISFIQTLISYKRRQNSYRLPELSIDDIVDEKNTGIVGHLSTSTLKKSTLTKILSENQNSYGIRYNHTLAYEIKFGEETFYFLLNSAIFNRHQNLSSFTTADSILGAIVLFDEVDEIYEIEYFILMTSKSQIYIDLVDIDGNRILYGLGKINNDAIEFKLQSNKSSCLSYSYIKGSISPKGFMFKEGILDMTIQRIMLNPLK